MEGGTAEAPPTPGAGLRPHPPAGVGRAGGVEVMGQHQGHGPAAPGRQVEAPGDGKIEPGRPSQLRQHHGHRARTQGLVHHPQGLGLGAHFDEAEPVGIETEGVEPGTIGVAGLHRRFPSLDQQPPRLYRRKGAAHQGQPKR